MPLQLLLACMLFFAFVVAGTLQFIQAGRAEAHLDFTLEIWSQSMRSGLAFALVLIAGCANPLNLQTAQDYFRGGQVNAAEGKWFNARMAFARAWQNAITGNAEDRIVAVYAYEYGRASGAICDWRESEKGLLKALELDQKAQGPAYMSMAELARMYHAAGQLEQSRAYFEKAKSGLDSAHADAWDPVGYATLLAEYREVASAMKLTELATALKAKEMDVRKAIMPDAKGHTQTPYGQYCDQESLD